MCIYIYIYVYIMTVYCSKGTVRYKRYIVSSSWIIMFRRIAGLVGFLEDFCVLDVFSFGFCWGLGVVYAL